MVFRAGCGVRGMREHTCVLYHTLALVCLLSVLSYWFEIEVIVVLYWWLLTIVTIWPPDNKQGDPKRGHFMGWLIDWLWSVACDGGGRVLVVYALFEQRSSLQSQLENWCLSTLP